MYTLPTWSKYVVLAKNIDELRVKDKRHIFQIMRTTPGMTEDTFLPQYGITTGEFAVWQVLGENVRKNLKRA